MRATFWLSLGMGLSLLAGCQDLEQCKNPGIVEACICGPDDTGERMCLPEQVWSPCNCGPDASVTGGMGGMTGGMGGMTGGMGGMTGGMGGMTGGMGGMTGGMGGMTGGMGGMTGGMGGMGGMNPDAGTDAETPMEGDAYAGCTVATVATDCHAGSTCIESDTPFLSEPGFVCAPACTMVEGCAAPEDTSSDATVACDGDRCRLACTALSLNPCPAGMTCLTEDGVNEYCFVVP